MRCTSTSASSRKQSRIGHEKWQDSTDVGSNCPSLENRGLAHLTLDAMATTPHWNLLTCNKVRALPPADQFASFAIAYLDSAQRLCNVLARSPKKATFQRGAVVLYLSSHALELFLKGAILRKAPNERFNHDLVHLYNRYKVLFPSRRFAFTKQRFETKYLGMTTTQIAQAKVDKPHIGELYRYPKDKAGKSWKALLGFEATTYAKDLAVLRKDFERLLVAYDY